MQTKYGGLVLVGLMLLGGAFAGGAGGPKPASEMTLTSADFIAGGTLKSAQVYQGYGCTGQNLSPQLKWSGVPLGTKSLALLVHDPDAPVAGGWWHWVVYNLPARTRDLAAGAGDPARKLLPAGSQQGLTSFGTAAYGGACPPQGDKPHHYHFTLYALNVEKLNFPAGTKADAIKARLEAHTINKVTLTARYGR